MNLYKSEIYKLAKYFNIDQSIINRNPSDDTYDASIDEVTIGCPYWFLEIFAYYKCKDNIPKIVLDYNNYWNNVEKIHNTNKHKYLVDGYPSIYFDVYERQILK